MLARAAAGDAPTVAPGWGQGRATYGGLVGALMLAAIKGRLGGSDRQPLRAMSVSFVSPVAPGPVALDVTILRAGKNVTQAQCLLLQDGAVATAALASFGSHRDSAVQVAPDHPMPVLPDWGSVRPLPDMPGVTPDFFSHVDLRLVDGGLPFSGADTSHFTGWMSLVEPPSTFTEEHIVALADAWPPVVVQMLPRPAPASSLTWTIELVDEMLEVVPDQPWVYEARTDVARDGYGHTHAMLWRPDGTLTVISRQTVTVFG